MSLQQVVINNSTQDHKDSGLGLSSLQSLVNTQSSSQAPALEVYDLTRDYRTGFRRAVQRGITGVSFAVKPGVIFALLGHNGAGKTTTINCILDLVHARAGQVKIFGQLNTNPSARQNIGYLPERPYFFEHLSGRELLRFYADLLHIPRQDREQGINKILEVVGLVNAADQRLRKYSKGMLQRIGLGQALLGDPDLLILDEPMSGLDPLGRRQVRRLLQELRDRGKTIILSSHIVPDIEMLADEVAILQEGVLVAQHQMSTLNQTTVYEVQLVVPVNCDTETLLAKYTVRDHGGAFHVEAAGVESLRELLNMGAERGWKVLGVGTRCSGLEELFMQSRKSQEELS